MNLEYEICDIKKEIRDVNASIRQMELYEELFKNQKSKIEYDIYFYILNEKRKEKKELRDKLNQLFSMNYSN